MRYAIGIDLGGTNIAAGIVTEDYKLLEKGSVPTKAQRPWQEVAADMARLAMELVEKAGLSRADCAGIGVGSPGICNGDTGEVVYSNNLYWDDVPLCPTLTRLTGLPCRLSNDANCAALGEVVAGAAKGCKTAVLLTLGTGVGGGVVIDGKIYEGQASAGAELGHCTLISGGVECTCGRRGCIESYASATALIRQASEAAAAHPESLLNKERITAKSVYDAMRAGDDAAKAVVAQYEEYLGEAIVDMVNIFRPEMLLLGGGISGEGKALTDPMNEYVKAHCFGGDKSFVTRVDTATLGNKAGIIGAAALCLSAPAAMPLKLAPAFKDYLWGGERLKSEYGKHTRLSPLAESWELSCHKDGPSTIVNGPDAGRTLAEYAARHPACVGTRHTDGVFPVLIKLIDAARPLSVQVHPDDALAAKRYGGYGKSEMWYVLDCDPGAELYLGFDGDVSRERYAEHVERGTLPEILSRPKVSPGDAFFIPAGTIHAIGKGILLAEIQQASDVTYRIYDWGRTDASGKGRELHTDLAADAIRFDNDIPYRITAEPRTNEAVPLKRSPYFTVNLIGLDGAVERNHVERDSFVVYMLTEGRATLGWEGGSETVKKGETLLVPACIEEVTLTGQGKLLEIYIE